MTDKMYALDNWGERLGDIMTTGGIRNATIATHMGVSRTTVGKWKSGGNIEYANLRELATFLNVNWIWLRYGDAAVSDLPTPNTPPLLPVSDRVVLKTLLEDQKLLELVSCVKGWGRWTLNLMTDGASVNDKAAEILGIDKGVIRTTADLHSRTHPDDRSWAWDKLKECVQDNDEVFHLFHRVINGPEIKTVEKIGYVVCDSLGIASEVLGMIREVVPRVKE
jgi:transcriptional regulator with XRE-family HTH domain